MLPIDQLTLIFLLLTSPANAFLEPAHAVSADAKSAPSEWSQSELLCPPGMRMSSTFPSLGWCYGIADFKEGIHGHFNKSFEDAQAICASTYGGSVPSIKSFDENQALLAIISEYPEHKAACWLGLKCGEDGKWYWLNGEVFEGYANFHENSKLNADSCDREVAMYNPIYYMEWTGRWNDRSFDSSHPFVCAKRPRDFNPTDYPETHIIQYECESGWLLIDGICHFLDAETKRSWTWDQARANCESRDATLPVILFKNQNERISWEFSMFYDIDLKPQFWIGLVCGYDGNFLWMDGSPFHYSSVVDEDGMKEKDRTCSQPDNIYYYGTANRWFADEKRDDIAAMLVCTKPATTGSTTSVSPKSILTPKPATGTQVDTTTTVIATSKSTSEPSTVTVIMTSTTVPAITSHSKTAASIWLISLISTLFMAL